MRVVAAGAFAAVGDAQAAAVAAEVGRRPDAAGVAAERAGLDRDAAGGERANVAVRAVERAAAREVERDRGAAAAQVLHDAARRVQPDFARLENVVGVAGLNALERDLAVGGAHVVGGVAGRAVVVDDRRPRWSRKSASPVLVTLYVQVTVEPGVRIGTPGPFSASSLS